jgi:hypothetical protein
MFLQFDSEYWIMPIECMLVYGIIPELDIYIDAKKNRRPLTQMEKDWIFNQRQAWDHERDMATTKRQPISKFIIKQPNIIKNNLIKEPSIKSNTINVSPPKKIIRKSTQKIKRNKKLIN